MKTYIKHLRTASLAAVFASISAVSFGQGLTTSELSGFVTDKDGQAIAGARVVAVLTSTGARYTALTRSTGQYNMVGLVSSGPYVVYSCVHKLPVTATAGLSTLRGVYLSLGSNNSVNLVVGPGNSESTRLAGDVGAGPVFNSGKMGSGTTMTAMDIGQVGLTGGGQMGDLYGILQF